MKSLPMAEGRWPKERRIRRRAGFTLVEVLASMAIVLVVLPVAMEAISMESSTSPRARRLLEAGNLAQSKLAELVATNAWQNGNTSGDFNPDFPDYTWTAQVTQYQGTTAGHASGSSSASGTTIGSTTTGSATGSALQQLDVTVTWPARNTTFSITLSTLVYSGS